MCHVPRALACLLQACTRASRRCLVERAHLPIRHRPAEALASHSGRERRAFTAIDGAAHALVLPPKRGYPPLNCWSLLLRFSRVFSSSPVVWLSILDRTAQRLAPASAYPSRLPGHSVKSGRLLAASSTRKPRPRIHRRSRSSPGRTACPYVRCRRSLQAASPSRSPSDSPPRLHRGCAASFAASDHCGLSVFAADRNDIEQVPLRKDEKLRRFTLARCRSMLAATALPLPSWCCPPRHLSIACARRQCSAGA